MKHTLKEIKKMLAGTANIQWTSLQDMEREVFAEEKEMALKSREIISDLVEEVERLKEVLNKIAYPTEWDSLTGGELLPIWFKELARKALETQRR